jgi:hypothetical protein
MHSGTKVWLENLKGKDHMEDLGVDGHIILELILEKLVGWIHVASGGVL